MINCTHHSDLIHTNGIFYFRREKRVRHTFSVIIVGTCRYARCYVLLNLMTCYDVGMTRYRLDIGLYRYSNVYGQKKKERKSN